MSVRQIIRCNASGCDETFDCLESPLEIKRNDAAREGWLLLTVVLYPIGGVVACDLCPLHADAVRAELHRLAVPPPEAP